MRLCLLVSILAAPAAFADELGSPERGATLAREVCAACHAVERGGVSAVPAASSFADVADLPSTTRQSLYVFLNTPHPTMPDLVLEPQESDDLIAYILSLKDG